MRIARLHDALSARAHPSATPPVVEWSRRAWASDLGLTALTLATFAVVFVLEPLSESFPLTSWLLLAAEIVFAVAVVAAITALTRRGWMAPVAMLLAVVIFAVRFVGRFDPHLATAEKLLGIVPLLVLMAVVMTLSLRAGPVSYHRIAGAVLSYLLIGILWARLYGLLSHLAPGAIAYASGGSAVLGPDDLIYFSIMTLTTAGYGDLVPVHPAARLLASLEAIVGVLFPVIYISRFVAGVQPRPAAR